MKNFLRYLIIIFILWITIPGCKPYKEHLMFTAPEEYNFADFQAAATTTEQNYIIQINDLLKMQVFTNKGERIVDPDFELMKEIPANQANTRPDPAYLVKKEGYVKLPMIGSVKLAGMTLEEANQYLQKRYNEFYTDCFVLLEFANKRVVILGSPGGQVIPLTNENVTVAEAIALAGGLQKEGKSHNIRLLRGSEMYLINLNSVEGYLNTNMIVQPGDIIYIEPIQKIASEAARDITPFVALLTSITTLILVIAKN